MSALLEVPRVSDLTSLTVDVVSDQAGVVSVSATAGDGDTAILTWDEITGTVALRWAAGGRERLNFTRESATRVTIREQVDAIEFHVWSRSEGIDGQLVVRVGKEVSVIDQILRG